MKGFKKIICGAIVCVLAIATAVTFVGCKEKDNGLSDAEKALRTNAVEVLNNMIVDATRVEALYEEGVDEEHVDDYVFYIGQYNMLKKMLNDATVALGEYYSIEINSEDNLEKYIFVYSIDLTDNEIIIKTENAGYERESTAQEFVLDEEGVGKDYYSIVYDKTKPISLTTYGGNGNTFYDYEYFKLASDVELSEDYKKLFDEYESVYKNQYDTDCLSFHYDYVKDDETISLRDENITGVALMYCNRILESIDEKTATIKYESTKDFPQEIEELFLEWFNSEW